MPDLRWPRELRIYVYQVPDLHERRVHSEVLWAVPDLQLGYRTVSKYLHELPEVPEQRLRSEVQRLPDVQSSDRSLHRHTVCEHVRRLQSSDRYL